MAISGIIWLHQIVYQFLLEFSVLFFVGYNKSRFLRDMSLGNKNILEKGSSIYQVSTGRFLLIKYSIIPLTNVRMKKFLKANYS